MTTFLERLPRTTVYILGLLAVALLAVVLLMWQNVEGAGAKMAVEKQLVAANAAILQTAQANNADTVTQELTAAQAQLKEISLPQQPPSVELVAVLVGAARETGVELGNLQVTSVEQEKVGSGSYNVMRQRLQFRGSPLQLSNFLNRVERGGFKSLVVNNISLTPKGTVWEARVDLYLYSSQ